jgi:hypothetical protein
MSPGIARTSFVIVWILTTSYRWSPVKTSLNKPLSRRHPDSPQRELFPKPLAHKSCLFAVPNSVKIFANVACVSSPFPAQQRWVERPPLPLLYILNNKPSPHALITPTALFHRSAHCYGAWIRPRFPGSTPSRGIRPASREAL